MSSCGSVEVGGRLAVRRTESGLLVAVYGRRETCEGGARHSGAGVDLGVEQPSAPSTGARRWWRPPSRAVYVPTIAVEYAGASPRRPCPRRRRRPRIAQHPVAARQPAPPTAAGHRQARPARQRGERGETGRDRRHARLRVRCQGGQVAVRKASALPRLCREAPSRTVCRRFWPWSARDVASSAPLARSEPPRRARPVRQRRGAPSRSGSGRCWAHPRDLGGDPEVVARTSAGAIARCSPRAPAARGARFWLGLADRRPSPRTPRSSATSAPRRPPCDCEPLRVRGGGSGSSASPPARPQARRSRAGAWWRRSSSSSSPPADA